MKPAEAFATAMRHHQAGQLAEAERLYAQVLAAEPGHLQALTLSGALAHMAGRNDEAADLFSRALAINEQPDLHYNLGLAKWALGRRTEAATHWSRALALNPNFAQAHMNLGNALREEGSPVEAVTHLRRALQLQPSPFAHNNLGLALAALGDREAAGHFQRAIAMHPDFVEPHLNLALELAAQGQIGPALASVRRSLQIKETADNKALFVRLVAALDAIGDDSALRQSVTRAVAESWERATDLAPVVATLVKHGSAIEGPIRRAEAAWPSLPPARELFGSSGLAAVAREPLLRWLLESGVICDVALEQFLTASRAALLEIAATDPDTITGDQLRFACALARQCFTNEYVYATSDVELARAGPLRDVLNMDGPVKASHIAVVAAYFPLHTLPCADALIAGDWPAPVAAVLAQQIRAPRADALCRAKIPRLTPIEDDVSLKVQDQYEQNPYPRWIALEPPRQYDSVEALMRHELPYAPFRALGKRDDLDILVAGCGTGRQPIGVAQQFERSRVLAIDLSTASLGYAKARTEALGVANIEYAQADILRLGSIGRTFDMTQCAGVMHHLADPYAGWQVLLSLLRPGGVMFIALYSEIARRDVVAARDFIKQRGYGSAAEDIRACRMALMAHDDGSPLRNVALFNDFFATSECRDLLFHVQERRMTLPEIKRFLGATGLTFLGFSLEPRVAQRYAARFPDDKAMTDLDCWHAFEQDNPYAFASMYRFWIQKSD